MLRRELAWRLAPAWCPLGGRDAPPAQAAASRPPGCGSVLPDPLARERPGEPGVEHLAHLDRACAGQRERPLGRAADGPAAVVVGRAHLVLAAIAPRDAVARRPQAEHLARPLHAGRAVGRDLVLAAALDDRDDLARLARAGGGGEVDPTLRGAGHAELGAGAGAALDERHFKAFLAALVVERTTPTVAGHAALDGRRLQALGRLEAHELPALDDHFPVAGARLGDRELRELGARVLHHEERPLQDRLVVVGARDPLAVRADQGELRRSALAGRDDRCARQAGGELDVVRTPLGNADLGSGATRV